MGHESGRLGQSPWSAGGHFAVTIMGITVPEAAMGGRRVSLRIDHPEAIDDHKVIGGLDSKTYQLQKPGVSHCSLVNTAGTPVAKIVRGASAGIPVFRQSQVVRQPTVRSVLSHRPFLYLRLPAVR